MRTVLEVLLATAVVYAVLVGALWWYARRIGQVATLRDAARFAPDVLALVRRLATSRVLSGRLRVALGALALYLVLPIDVVPDVLPVVGWADDVVLVVLALRAVIRRAGAELIPDHWTGSPAGLAVLLRLTRTG